MMRTACCWAVALFFEVELQHLFHVFSCVAEARYLMLSAKLAFTVQPIVEQISAGKDYLQRLQSQVILPFGFIVGVYLFKGVIQYFGKFIQVIWHFGKFNQPLMAAFGMLDRKSVV